MGLYNDWVIPRIIDLGMDTKVLRKERARALRDVRGTVLEVGFGTGHNLPFYPEKVERLVAIDPAREGAKLARSRIAAAPFPVEFIPLTTETIDTPDASFDSVVSTYTLCTIADPVAALAQIRRVLKPDGRFYLLEHGISPDSAVQRWQARLNGLNRCVLGGCNLNRNIEGLVRDAGFDFELLDNFYIEGDPKFVGYVTRGTAAIRAS